MNFRILFFLAFLAFFFSFDGSLKAQGSTKGLDTMLLFKAPLQLESGGKDFIGYSEMSFVLQEKSKMKNIPLAYAKKFALPRTAKISSGPIIIRSFVQQVDGDCFRFSCNGGSCDGCHLIWLDRNGDGKIQPATEVRCYTETGKIYSLRVKRVKCE